MFKSCICQFEFVVAALLYPVRSQWGTYRGCCPRRDSAWTSGYYGELGRPHTRNNPHVKCTHTYQTAVKHLLKVAC